MGAFGTTCDVFPGRDDKKQLWAKPVTNATKLQIYRLFDAAGVFMCMFKDINLKLFIESH